jgi:spermidine/putrescine transport system ATP-binding protein
VDNQIADVSKQSAHDLELLGVSKRFDDHLAVDDVSFAVGKGEFFSILGPSGCGKTTLMRLIAGFAEPSAGEIRIGGRTVLGIPANRRPVNMVFQSLALFPMMSVGENVAYGLRCRGIGKAEATTRMLKMLERVGLPGFANRAVATLSGGQRQRVAIARCLVLEPTLVLLDEPLGALDLKLREQMKLELKQIQATFDTTFVYITHDQSEALVMSNRVAVMNSGRFEQVGTPRELYHNPATRFVAGFVGDTNSWTGEAVRSAGGSVAVHLPGGSVIEGTGRADNTRAACFVRPEAISIASTPETLGILPNRFSGRVSAVLFDGANSSVMIEIPDLDQPLRASLPQVGPMAGLSVGAPVVVGWTAEAARIFPA